MPDNKISVKLLPPSTQHDEENRAKFFEEILLKDIDNSIKSEWAIIFEEIGYADVPVYKAMIYSTKEDYKEIMGIMIINLLNKAVVNKYYYLDVSEIAS